MAFSHSGEYTITATAIKNKGTPQQVTDAQDVTIYVSHRDEEVFPLDVTIERPLPFEQFRENEELRLKAVVNKPFDTITWSISDGTELAHTKRAWVTASGALGPGTHNLTVTVISNEGFSDEETDSEVVTIYVVFDDASRQQTTPKSEDDEPQDDETTPSPPLEIEIEKPTSLQSFEVDSKIHLDAAVSGGSFDEVVWGFDGMTILSGCVIKNQVMH